MDSLITAAGRALAAGDPLGALQRVALRDDAPALALRGIAMAQLGDAYVRQARWDDAIRVLQQSVWLNPYYSAPYILLGRAYLTRNQLSAAEGMLRRAIDYDPNNRAAHYTLAQVLQRSGRTDEAQREFRVVALLFGAVTHDDARNRNSPHARA